MRRRHRLVALSAAVLAAVGLSVATPAAAAPARHLPGQGGQARQSAFGFMLPGLPGFTSPTPQQLADLAQTQLDPNADSENNQDPEMTSVYTYFGQFIDHDLTLDTLPQPEAPVDPTTLLNSRTFRFDLDSVYGGGPEVSPQLYADDHKHFLVQNPNPNGVVDLPRNPDGSAILVEHRNDENEVISQIHTAFLLLHNKEIDRGLSFAAAQRRVIDLYQTLVVKEVLPHFVGPDVAAQALAGKLPHLYHPGNPNRPMTPVEFSVAAYRFGHSMVRKAYELTTTTGKIQVFSATAPDLRGGRQLPAGRQIDWGNFVKELERPDNAGHVNQSRKIDALISSSLFALPIPGAEATGSNVLAFRNMLRAKFYGMADGQDVAKAMGIDPIPPADFHLDPAFDAGTPLWYYILAESSRADDGKFLGPVGGRIVADVFTTLLRIDRNSILRGQRKFTPSAPEAPEGTFDFGDFFVAAGLAKFPAA